MEVVGDRIVMPNMATIRAILVYASVITTVFMLVWMISEQEKVRFKNAKTLQMNEFSNSTFLIVWVYV